MSILKLKEAGDTATLAITACELVQGEYGPQIKFDADNGDTLYVPQSSVDRQLDRMGVADYDDAVGKTLTFFRAPNHKPGGKPWWNIDKAHPDDVRTPPSNGKAKLLPNENGSEDYHQETGAPPTEGTGAVAAFDVLVRKYGECMDAVIELMKLRKMTGTPESYTAMVATLFISRTQKNV